MLIAQRLACLDKLCRLAELPTPQAEAHLQFVGAATAHAQGIAYLTRNGNSATFLSYVCNAKKNKELFHPT